MNIVFCTQARMGSSRLPGKVLLPIDKKRTLGWVLHQADSTTTLDEILLTIGDRPENKVLTEWAERNGHDFLTGPESDLLARFEAVAKLSTCDLLVRVTGDCPFVPPSEIDRVVTEHRSNDSDYTTNRTSAMPVGTAVDVIEPAVVTMLSEQNARHPVKPLLSDPDDYRVTVTGSNDWEQYSESHLAVDTPDDYWRLTDAVEDVGGSPEAVARALSDEPNSGED